MQTKTNQKGMTLVELMVSLAVITLLMAAISTLITKSFFINQYTYEQGLNNTELHYSLRDLSTTLREAKQGDSGEYAILEADDFELTFFADIDDDSATEKVHYFLENGSLMQGTSEPAGFPLQYPAGDEQVKQIGRGIVNTATQPIFYYLNSDYPEDMTNNPLPTPCQTDDISLIKIDIYANIDPGHAPDNMRMETFVKPRNIGSD